MASVNAKPLLVSVAQYAVALVGAKLPAAKTPALAAANKSIDATAAVIVKAVPTGGIVAQVEHGSLVNEINGFASNLKAQLPGIYDTLSAGLVQLATAAIESWAAGPLPPTTLHSLE